MATPNTILKAYARRIKRGDITLEDITNKAIRTDVDKFINENPEYKPE